MPKRTQEVLVRRAGLKNNKLETLEAIGDDFGVTRERVRQIEEAGLRLIRANGLPSEVKDFEAVVARHMLNFSGAREENVLLEELKFLFDDRHPASRSRIRFLLTLSGRFAYTSETGRRYAFWADSQESAKSALKFLDVCVREMKRGRQPIQAEEIEPFTKKVGQLALTKSFPSTISLALMGLSKEVAVNPFGEFGLVGWSEIVPKGVRDRAYRILRQERQPLHFKELAGRMNAQARLASNFHPAWQKEIEVQTVHNELIKDQNFVLVGRGLYALKEWGYEAGTVKDVLASVLRKAKQPLTKEDIVAQVKAQRFVQENTILINLQDRKTFERTRDGRYRARPGRIQLVSKKQVQYEA
ncbi:MAG: hypothetical protein HYS57_01115 [Parcubacteria group bacterium]|nr:hypothetical protein [Parcubacteria group bacterium]